MTIFPLIHITVLKWHQYEMNITVDYTLYDIKNPIQFFSVLHQEGTTATVIKMMKICVINIIINAELSLINKYYEYIHERFAASTERKKFNYQKILPSSSIQPLFWVYGIVCVMKNHSKFHSQMRLSFVWLNIILFCLSCLWLCLWVFGPEKRRVENVNKIFRVKVN